MMAPERLRAFLADVQRGTANRYGYERLYVQWEGVPATRAQKADLEAALRLGLVHWPSLVPGTAAALTGAGVALLESFDADRLLRASVPAHWKNATSPVGAVQSYIAELEALQEAK